MQQPETSYLLNTWLRNKDMKKQMFLILPNPFQLGALLKYT